ncbi:MAG: DUF4097 family beta strand repeat-containing protein [Lachnospiraceae bacterium]|nr:DUF4097 family beta strand repeat-containing protein [Lachnospiraceae bacterium]
MKTLNDHLQETFGCKVYKIALNGGFTCPNRDGTLEGHSGGIKILSSDAQDIELKATSGSIKAEFLTNKDCRANAVAGSVTVPDASAGEQNGTCVANTTSGSIKIFLLIFIM